MDEKAFKKHLHDLAHGHHHPEEHDWTEGASRQKRELKPAGTTKERKTAARTARRKK